MFGSQRTPMGRSCRVSFPYSVLLDMKAFLPHIPQEQFPCEAFTAALYVDSGTRAVGLGQLAFGGFDKATNQIIYSPLEAVRLAIPRRVYTDKHMDVVAKSVMRIYEKRQELKGMQITWAPEVLRHFTAQLAPIS